MCIFLTTPESSIEIQFLSESISLESAGSAITTVDILLKNTGKSSIKNLHIVYPGNFLELKVYKKLGRLYEIAGSTANRTGELLDRNNPTNTIYNVSGFEIVPATEKVTIIKPNPENPIERKNYEGLILSPSSDKFRICNAATEDGLVYLGKLGFTPFIFSFSEKVRVGQSRWIRLEFKCSHKTIYYPRLFRRIALWAMNSLRYSYHLMGPFDVLRIMKERVDIQKSIVERQIQQFESSIAHRKKVEIWRQEDTALNNIKRNVLHRLNPDNVKILDFSLHIFPRRLRQLHSFFVKGNLYPNGVLPNYFPDSNGILKLPAWKRRVYDWSVEGELNSKSKGFDLFFSGFVENRLIQFLLFLVAAWFTAEKGILPLLIVALNYFSLNNFAEKVANFNQYIFVEQPWVSFWASVIVGMVLTPLVPFFVRFIVILYLIIKKRVLKINNID